MNTDFKWIFDGIGTQLLGIIFGVLLGGAAGYKIIKKNIGQKQKAKDGARQIQQMVIESGEKSEGSCIDDNIRQSQEFGNNAERIQVGKSEENIEQKQIAGNDSTQVQVNNLTINQGIDEKRAREVFSEMIPMALNEYTKEAFVTANARIGELEKIVIPKIMSIDGAVNAFKDPAFQILLKKAQQSAATTGNDKDYSLLSELLVCHIQKGDNRRNRTGISKAIEIVDYIDNDALCALTIVHAISQYIPIDGEVEQGLNRLNELFSKLLYTKLPTGIEWIDHLDVLGTIRINQFGKFKTFRELYPERLEGYTCIGIKEGADEYKKALDILSTVNLNETCLQKNCYLPGYVRIPVINKHEIKDLKVYNSGTERKISGLEIPALESIWEFYSKDQKLKKEVIDKFMKQWDSFEVLRQIREWYEKIPISFDVTKVGMVLAHTNAKRCEPTIPDLL